MNLSKAAAAIAVSLCLAGCETHLYDHLPVKDAAYRITPPIEAAVQPDHYEITPGDELTYSVHGEPDMSIDKLVVDDAGYIQIPLIGPVRVGGASLNDAKLQIEQLLGSRYIKDPKVTLNLTTPMPKLVSVEGEVTTPGSYPITRDTSLLSALALAKSPTNKANHQQVVIFRTVDGKRMAARFDITRIRAGVDPDPQILNGDVVVVGLSHTQSGYRDFLQMAPFFNVFTQIKY